MSGLDANALRISVLAGDVVLRNLQLKPEALAKLDLPITVKAGLLGSLKLKARRALNLPCDGVCNALRFLEALIVGEADRRP